MTQPSKEQVAEFEKGYNELCEKHGMVLNFVPQWKQSQDTGSWSMVIIPMVAMFNPPEQNDKANSG